jgi:hypothetical protein
MRCIDGQQIPLHAPRDRGKAGSVIHLASDNGTRCLDVVIRPAEWVRVRVPGRPGVRAPRGAGTPGPCQARRMLVLSET